MKNKKAVYILMPLVVLIWAIIFYRIFSAASGEDGNTGFQSMDQLPEQEADTNQTFTIAANYPDPFLKTAALVSVKKVEKKPPVVKPIVNIKWPNIVYGGTIKNQQSKKQVALVEINGTSNMMRLNEEVGGVQLKRIYNDSIEVVFQQQRKMIVK
jgi:hypothetical protein